MPLHLDLMRLRNTEVIVECEPWEPLPYFEEMKTALRDAFPSDAEQFAPAGALPPNVARFTLTSKNSQLLVSGNGFRFAVQYFGNFETHFDLARDYVKKKVDRALRFLSDKGMGKITFLGVLHHLDISAGGMDFDPGSEVATHFLNETSLAAAEDLDDIELRLGLCWKDRYFLNYTFQNYRMMSAQVAIAGPHLVKISQANPQPVDVGIRLKMDLNTKLLSRKHEKEDLNIELDELATMIDEANNAISEDLDKRFGGTR